MTRNFLFLLTMLMVLLMAMLFSRDIVYSQNDKTIDEPMLDYITESALSNKSEKKSITLTISKVSEKQLIVKPDNINIYPSESPIDISDYQNLLVNPQTTQNITITSGPEVKPSPKPTAKLNQIQTTAIEVIDEPKNTPSIQPKIIIPSNISASALELFALINKEREKAGVPLLKLNKKLSMVARIKAYDFVENQYFAHQSPLYGSPFEMMKYYNIEFTKAGENLAKTSTALKANILFMNSEGHRRKTLREEYKYVGIGVYKSKYFVVMFTN